MKKEKNFFSQLIDKHFNKLSSEYGFKKVEPDRARGEYWVKFKNKTTAITFHCELLTHYSDPWVVVSDLSPDRQRAAFEFLLHVLEVLDSTRKCNKLMLKEYLKRRHEIKAFSRT